ncbi:MAG TPA: hypothetical protein VFJ19_13830 [Nocardioidaceae bacterium]|nr:hypothetical protein [Nocardioidaceae bacterium]
MTDTPSTAATAAGPEIPDAATEVTPPAKPTLGKVLRDARRILTVALVLTVAAFWILVPLGKWEVAVFLAAGILLGLANHVASEFSLLKMISSGAQVTRSEIAGKSFVRLLVVSLAGGAVAVIFWSTGIVTLIGLALFRLITLVMTTLPLLKELSKS